MNCSQCGAEVAQTDTFCGACGNPVSGAAAAPPLQYGSADPAQYGTPTAAPPPPGAPTSPPMAPPIGAYVIQRFADPVTGAPVAEWWQRAVALIIDWFAVGIPGGILIGILVAASTKTTYVNSGGFLVAQHTTSGGILVLSYFLFAAIYFCYYVFLNGGKRGQTLGKMALGIATRDETGRGPLGYGRAAGRWGICILLAIPFYIPLAIDYLSPLWDPRRQAWHDKAVRSLVVIVR